MVEHSPHICCFTVMKPLKLMRSLQRNWIGSLKVSSSMLSSCRELSKGRDGGKAEPSLPRNERRLLQIVVRRDHVFQDSYLQVTSGVASARSEILRIVL